MHNLIEFLESTYQTHQDKTAVESAGGNLTFAQLRQNALQIAMTISETMLPTPTQDASPAKGGGASFDVSVQNKAPQVSSHKKERIAVYLPKGTECLSAMLGVLYGGHVYVPMDTRTPINRTKLILDTVRPCAIITDASGKSFLSENRVPVELLADVQEMLAQNLPIPAEYIENTLAHTQDTDPAYMLFTSGSTGVPKGVVIPHRRVISYIQWARDFFSISDGEIIGSQAPFYFTVSAMDIYLCLATGSTLSLIPENQFSRPLKLLGYLNEHKITLIFWVSSVYHHIAKAEALATQRPMFLKHAWFVGEPIPADSLSYWVETLPDVAFTNLYGSTETDMTLCYRVPKSLPIKSVPLGQACANIEVLLIKDDQTAAKPGEMGEICVRGSCLALGYYQNPERTAAAFVQNPLHNDYPDIVYRTGDLGEWKDGLVFFHGRRDHQFKHLGYRIEAGDIEAVAAKHEAIANACVIYDEIKRQIVLFYEADGEIDEPSYRLSFMDELPAYMVPTRLVRLEAMPFNANRKKDRISLKSQYIENQGGMDK